jgi:hypothetical protein
MAETLAQCEREVELARVRLSGDLARLRAPATFSSFTQAVKDDLLNHAQGSAMGAFDVFVEEAKAKAAANPMATLSVGAGLALYFMRRPPVVSLLLGLGVIGLLRTRAQPRPGMNYVEQGRARLKEQVSELTSEAMARANTAKEQLSEAGGRLAEEAAATVQGWASAGRETLQRVTASASEAKDQMSETGARMAGEAGVAVQGWVDAGRDAARKGFAAAVGGEGGGPSDAVRGRSRSAGQPDFMSPPLDPPTTSARDSLLLGLAGAAVAAAVGLAYQKRA